MWNCKEIIYGESHYIMAMTYAHKRNLKRYRVESTFTVTMFLFPNDHWMMVVTAWIHTYMHTYIHHGTITATVCLFQQQHENKHAYIHTNIHTYIHTYIHIQCSDCAAGTYISKSCVSNLKNGISQDRECTKVLRVCRSMTCCNTWYYMIGEMMFIHAIYIYIYIYIYICTYNFTYMCVLCRIHVSCDICIHACDIFLLVDERVVSAKSAILHLLTIMNVYVYIHTYTQTHTMRSCLRTSVFSSMHMHIHAINTWQTQCPSGQYSSRNAQACTKCPAGKYLTNSAGGSETASCSKVSQTAFTHVYKYAIKCYKMSFW